MKWFEDLTENRMDKFTRDNTRPPSEIQARTYFRIHDMDENGMITRMDLFQSLNMANTQGKHYPPDILKVIQDLFEPAPKGLANAKGEIHMRGFIEAIQKRPEMTRLFWDFFEITVFGAEEIDATQSEKKTLTDQLLEHMSADELPEWYEHDSDGGNQLEETTKMAEARLFDGVEGSHSPNIFDRLG